MEYFLPGRIFQSTVRLRSAIGGKSVRERSVGMCQYAQKSKFFFLDFQGRIKKGENCFKFRVIKEEVKTGWGKQRDVFLNSE